MKKIDYHNRSVKACLELLKTSPTGLSILEAEKRLAHYGANKFSDEKKKSSIELFFSQFRSPLIYILIFAGIVSALLSDVADAIVIFSAVLLNTVIGFVQETKANNALASLRSLVQHRALVMRDSMEMEIDSTELTIGDLIIIQAGSRIPVDARLVEAVDLQLNEASLTGESSSATKHTEKVAMGATLADRDNMVYSGTVVVRGIGKAVVTAVGGKTEIGKIAELVNDTKEEKTPLQIRLDKLSAFFGIAVGIISIIVFTIGVWQGRAFLEMFVMAVAIAVAAIPEGLVVAVTVILVLGMQEILRRKSLVRKLVAAETLGSTTVICTDKTGTLTEGRMQVVHIVIGEREFEMSSPGSHQESKEAKLVSFALQAGMMCNDAAIDMSLEKKELGEPSIIGTPTETALLLAAIGAGLDREKLLKLEPRIDELPFTSESKFMLTLHRHQSSYLLYEKGAPEVLLAKCQDFYHKNKRNKLTLTEKKKLIEVCEKMTAKGLHVLGIAHRELGAIEWNSEADLKDWKGIDQKLTFIGFIAFRDPLRPESKETIQLCRMAGIRPIIITGDHRLTARTIAEELGFRIHAENIITGEALDKISDEKLKALVKKIDIYARVSPHHKLRIVKALQSNGEVVAMTGDGINDSPAIKAADIGIALGNGTDVAKETSDLILLDNNFSTIVSAIKQGRVILSNIRKVITYLTSDGLSEITLVMGSLLFGTPLAILPAQILWINIVNDGLPNFAMAFEKLDDGVMREKPISKKEPIINREMKIIIFGVGIVRDVLIFGAFYYLFLLDADIVHLRSLFFTALGFKSLISLFSLRSFRKPIWRMNPFENLYLVGAFLVSLSLLMVAVYWPPLQSILGTASLGMDSWVLIIIIAVVNIAMIEFTKFFFLPHLTSGKKLKNHENI